jgi:hypothetical protein
MAQKEYPVYGDGIKGVMIGPARFLDDSAERLIRLEDGSELRVPTSALEPQADGSFYLRQRTESTPPQVAPPTPTRTAKASVPSPPTPTPALQAESVESQLFRHGYTVRKVSVDRVLDEPVGPRQEGDTMIYPVMEEVLVVQKKLILREEIHVTPERSAIEPRRIEVDSKGLRNPTD